MHVKRETSKAIAPLSDETVTVPSEDSDAMAIVAPLATLTPSKLFDSEDASVDGAVVQNPPAAVTSEFTIGSASNAATDEVVTFQSLGLDHRLVAATQRLKYIQPTPIQIDTIKFAFKGKGIVAKAKTGSGKTAAFLLPILHQILTSKKQVAIYLFAHFVPANSVICR